MVKQMTECVIELFGDLVFLNILLEWGKKGEPCKVLLNILYDLDESLLCNSSVTKYGRPSASGATYG